MYNSVKSLRHPIRVEFTLEESGNLVSLYDAVAGRSFSEKDKTLFKTPYSQFVRLEGDFTKTWTLTPSSQLVAHANGGFIYCYGNSDSAPFSELFYCGGANTVRAFGVREIGPGTFYSRFLGRQIAYLLQNGEAKFVANLEYRTKLFGDLNGALFLDAGNVWNFQREEIDEGEYPKSFREFFDQLAVGTGVGLRYDLGFLVIRLDWGVALHCPYDTERSGYFNTPGFKHTLNFAVGYPF